MAAKANIVIDQGTSFETAISVTDDAGQPIDLTNATAQSQVRKHFQSSNAISFDTQTITSQGQVVLSLSANVTANVVPGRYVYDVVLVRPGNTVTRIVEGIVTVTAGVTR